jgi:hypothetical protein
VKALAVILAVLLMLAHPAAVIAVLGAELAVCSALGWLVWRIVRPGRLYRPWRTA